jgi:hypothetical protein
MASRRSASSRAAPVSRSARASRSRRSVRSSRSRRPGRSAAQTNAVLKSTGGAAKVSAAAVADLATAISQQDGDRRRGDPVEREHAAHVHEVAERDRQGQRHLHAGDEGRHGHVGRARPGRHEVSDPARQGPERPDQGRHRPRACRCDVHAGPEGPDQDARGAPGITSTRRSSSSASSTRSSRGPRRRRRRRLQKAKVAAGNLEEALGKGLAPVVDTVLTKFTNLARKVEPQLNRVTKQISGTFNRKRHRPRRQVHDLVGEGAAQARPVRPAVQAALKIRRTSATSSPSAIEAAAPKIADAMAAGRTARRWRVRLGRSRKAGRGGSSSRSRSSRQKFGAFSAVGSWAAGQFTTR